MTILIPALIFVAAAAEVVPVPAPPPAAAPAPAPTIAEFRAQAATCHIKPEGIRRLGDQPSAIYKPEQAALWLRAYQPAEKVNCIQTWAFGRGITLMTVDLGAGAHPAARQLLKYDIPRELAEPW